jgi:hypothetical protein
MQESFHGFLDEFSSASAQQRPHQVIPLQVCIIFITAQKRLQSHKKQTAVGQSFRHQAAE